MNICKIKFKYIIKNISVINLNCELNINKTTIVN